MQVQRIAFLSEAGLPRNAYLQRITAPAAQSFPHSPQSGGAAAPPNPFFQGPHAMTPAAHPFPPPPPPPPCGDRGLHAALTPARSVIRPDADNIAALARTFSDALCLNDADEELARLFADKLAIGDPAASAVAADMAPRMARLLQCLRRRQQACASRGDAQGAARYGALARAVEDALRDRGRGDLV